jgi:DNA-binding NtrC family response regulator
MAAAVSGSVAVAPPEPVAASGGEFLRVPIGTTVEAAEKDLILRTLEYTKNNKTRAAEILAISLKTLHNKLKEYGARDAAL